MSNKPYSSHHFWIELKGITEGSFSECSGLESEVEVDEWKEGGLNDLVHRFPGRVKTAPSIVLKRGLATPELWKWYHDLTQGKLTHGQIKRQSLSIILYDSDNSPLMRWNINGVLPIKWSGPTFKADAGEIAVESLELIHQGFVRV